MDKTSLSIRIAIHSQDYRKISLLSLYCIIISIFELQSLRQNPSNVHTAGSDIYIGRTTNETKYKASLVLLRTSIAKGCFDISLGSRFWRIPAYLPKLSSLKIEHNWDWYEQRGETSKHGHCPMHSKAVEHVGRKQGEDCSK